MNKLQKTILAAAAICTMTSSFAGEVLDGIIANKQINIGHRESSVPYSYVLSNGLPIGYSLDVCKEIIRDVEAKTKLSLTVQKQPVNGQTRIPLVQNKSIALECGSTSFTDERATKVSFAIIDADPVTPAVMAGNKSITKLEDFKGKTIVTVAGTTGEKIFRLLNSKESYSTTIILAKDYPQAFLLMSQGRAEAVVTNNVLLAGEISKLPNGKDFKVLSNVVVGPHEPIGIMFNKDDKEFGDIVKASIARQKADGTLERLYSKWFTQPIAPNNSNLNLKWTPEQRKIIWGAK